MNSHVLGKITAHGKAAKAEFTGKRLLSRMGTQVGHQITRMGKLFTTVFAQTFELSPQIPFLLYLHV